MKKGFIKPFFYGLLFTIKSIKWSVVEKINDKTRRVHVVEDFSGFILYLHDILHCGIIMPETIEKYGNIRTYPI